MSLIETRPVARRLARLPVLFKRLADRLAASIARALDGEDVPADPTAGFTPREWSDLPTWHPDSDE